MIVGTWINVIGYLWRDDSTDERASTHPTLTVDAVLVWPVGPISDRGNTGKGLGVLEFNRVADGRMRAMQAMKLAREQYAQDG